MSKEIQNPNDKKYDLVERTSKFGEDIIIFAQSLPDNPVNRPLIVQLVKAGTSVGANNMEADCAESRKDFFHKIGICKKEAKETMHWLRMIMIANPNRKSEAEILRKEAHELTLIFSAITKKK